MKFFSMLCTLLLIVSALIAGYIFSPLYKSDNSLFQKSFSILQKNPNDYQGTENKIATEYVSTGTNLNPPKAFRLNEKQVNYNKSLAFTSLTKETTISALQTKGTIPTWLSGTLLRNGPAQFELNEYQFNHWFDGFAMMHRFTFNNGTVSYANKFLETSYRSKSLKKGKLPSCINANKQKKSSWFSAVGKLFAKTPIYDNTNVNIAKYGNNFVALTETPYAIAFDPQTLRTLGNVVYDDKIDGHVCTAHPLFDQETKETFNVLINYGKTSYYQIYKMQEGTTQRKLITSIQSSLPSYVHSFALTKNYIGLILVPLVINPLDLLFSNKSYINNFQWKPENGTQLIIIDRKTGKRIGSYKTEPFFFFHIINSYEENDTLLIDLISFSDHSVIYNTKLKKLRTNKSSNSQPMLKRLIIDLKEETITTKQLTAFILDLPKINDNYLGRNYTYIYGVDPTETKLIKLNIKNFHIKNWNEAGCFTTEPIFVPKPNSKKEDEGVILSTVLDSIHNHSFLLILDAQTMKELARATLPHHIPFGFHGQFYSS